MTLGGEEDLYVPCLSRVEITPNPEVAGFLSALFESLFKCERELINGRESSFAGSPRFTDLFTRAKGG